MGGLSCEMKRVQMKGSITRSSSIKVDLVICLRFTFTSWCFGAIDSLEKRDQSR